MSTPDASADRPARVHPIRRAIVITILVASFPVAGWSWGARSYAGPDDFGGALVTIILVSSIVAALGVLLLALASAGPSRGAPFALAGGLVLFGAGLLVALWGRDLLAFPGWLGLLSIGVGAVVLVLAVQRRRARALEQPGT